jgi:nucleotide-binding universal stress UspA family protein
MKMQKILVPIDFSSRSFAALERAIDLAREYQSEIVLVHVIEPLPSATGRWSDPTQLLEHSAEDARKKLACVAEPVRQIYPRCCSELRFGYPAEAISDLVKQLNVDLIVVAAGPHTGLFQKILRSLAEKLVCQAPCPVLAVHINQASDGASPVVASAGALES